MDDARKPRPPAMGKRRPPDPSAAEGRSRALLDALPDAVAEIDGDGHFHCANPEAARLLGGSLEELLARVDPADRAEVGESLRKVLASSADVSLVYRMQPPAPQPPGNADREEDRIWVETRAIARSLRDGSVRAVVSARDITHARSTEEALRQSEERYRSLADNASDLILELDESGRVLYISPSCTELIGVSPEALIGLSIEDSDLVMDSPLSVDGLSIVDGLQQTLQTWDGVNQARWRVTRPDGSEAWLDGIAQRFRRRDGSVRVVVISRDVTRQVLAEQELGESEERYRIVNAMSRDVITEMDHQERLVYVSPTCEELLGFTADELVSDSPALAIVHPDDVANVRSRYESAMKSGEPANFPPFRVRHKDGSWRWFEGVGMTYARAGGELSFLGRGRDITAERRRDLERRQLEKQMQQAQKLEGLGVMAGGIAHDFNNLLTPILGDASMALSDLPDVSAIRSRLEKIQRAAQRAASLTSQMLAYAGQDQIEAELVNLSELVQEMGDLLASATLGRALLRYDLPDGLPPIEADAAQVMQVVMNLITNALEAVEAAECMIEVRTGTMEATELSPEQAVLGNDLAEGSYVFFEVRDTGPGMSEATRERIFDPFYTTKFTGRGLGLAAVLGIVRSHRGAIEIDSAPGRGTRFRVLFPCASQAAELPPPVEAELGEWRGSGTILVVDDEEDVRELMEETLLRCGFTLLTAADGPEGIDLFDRNADSIRLVLLDRTMPLLSGEHTFDAMRAIRPDARIVLVSGYSEGAAAEYFAGRGLAGFLQKPFLPADLVARVRDLIGDD